MKTKFLPVLVCVVAFARPLSAEVTLIFNDHGAGGGDATSGYYAPGSAITFDIIVRYSNPPPKDMGGISLWFQSLFEGSYLGNVFAVTSLQRGDSLFFNENSNVYPQPLNTGFYGADNQYDLGAATIDGPEDVGLRPGDYFFGTITFQLSMSAEPGVYTLRNVYAPLGDPNYGHGTVASDARGTDVIDIPSTNYTVIVPEGSVLLYAAGGAILVSLILRRAKRRK
ncbi:MAG TPA: hypothetical protein VG095_03985 [Chthoniobacterales bacterium]|nr:hypothetical protein [Chthoniobacterales bacterium]